MARPAELMAGDYYDEHHLAEALGHVIRTLRGWRSRGDGPPYVIVGRRVFYRKDGVRDWLLSKEKASAAA